MDKYYIEQLRNDYRIQREAAEKLKPSKFKKFYTSILTWSISLAVVFSILTIDSQTSWQLMLTGASILALFILLMVTKQLDI